MAYDTRHDFFEKVSRKVNIKQANLVMYYCLKRADGEDGEKIRCYIAKDDELEDSLDILYSQAEDSKTVIYVTDVPADARPPRPHEELFKSIIKTNYTVDRQFYKVMVEHPEIAVKYLKKRAYISLLLGKDGSNLLNPAYFICHIQCCMKLVKLNSFCNLTNILTHYDGHASQELLDGEGKLIARRHAHLTGRLGKRNWKEVLNLDEELESLNQVIIESGSLKINTQGKFYPHGEMTDFPGMHLMCNLGVLQKIEQGDPCALANLPEQPANRMIQCLAGGKRRKGKKKLAPLVKKRILINDSDSDEEDTYHFDISPAT